MNLDFSANLIAEGDIFGAEIKVHERSPRGLFDRTIGA